MKAIFYGAALAMFASAAVAQANDTAAMSLARSSTPVPCGGADNIASAEFINAGQAVRVTCQRRGLFARASAPVTNAAPAGAPVTNAAPVANAAGVAPAGAPVTNFVPLIGGLAGALGVGAAVALGVSEGGSSTPSTN